MGIHRGFMIFFKSVLVFWAISFIIIIILIMDLDGLGGLIELLASILVIYFIENLLKTSGQGAAS